VGPALALLIITGFVCLAFWGRSAAGQETLTRIYGAPPPTRGRKNGSAARRTTAPAPDRPAAKQSKSARSGAAKAPAPPRKTAAKPATGSVKPSSSRRGGAK